MICGTGTRIVEGRFCVQNAWRFEALDTVYCLEISAVVVPFHVAAESGRGNVVVCWNSHA